MITNGTITTPINLTDPYTVLGVGSSTNGYDLGYICGNGHGKIKIWAKNKPLSYPKVGELTDAEKKSTNYGLTYSSIPWVNTYEACISYIDETDLSSYYTYTPPSGGDSSPYRMTDFIDYDNNAMPPIYASNQKTLTQGVYNETDTILNGTNKYVDVYVGIRGSYLHPNEIKLENLDWRTSYNSGNLYQLASDCYLGVILKGTNGTFQSIISTAKVGDLAVSDGDIAFRINDYRCYGTYKLMPFLCASSTLPAPGSNGQTVVNCLPLTMAINNITIVQAAAKITMTVYWTRSNSGSGYKITITKITFNNTGTDSGAIDKINLSFIGTNITSVQERNIINNSISVPVGSTDVTSFNNPNVYTTATSSIYGSMVVEAFNQNNSVSVKSTSFSGSVPASGSF